MHFQLDWLRAIRHLTQYAVPGLILAAVIIELAGWTFTSPSLASAYDYLLAIIFSLLTILMISICGWTVFLWDIDRLFFKLESKISIPSLPTCQPTPDRRSRINPYWVAPGRCSTTK